MPPAPADLTLANWDLGGPVSSWSYRHTAELFPVRRLQPGRRSTPIDSDQELEHLLLENAPELSAELATGRVSTVTILSGGRMLMRWTDGGPANHLLMSISKVIASIAVGVLEDRGTISYDASIRDHLPELDRGWDHCTVQHVLDMTSGVDCPEVGEPGAYQDPDHPFYRFEASLGWRPSDHSRSPYDLVRGYRHRAEPGAQYAYTSVNTFLLAWLIERATGTSYPDALQDLIWNKLALQADSSICVNDSGVAVSHGGLIMSTDDLARFGTIFTSSRAALGHSLELPTSYLTMLAGAGDRLRRAIGTQTAPTTPGGQWNAVYADGNLYKSGFGGQGLFVSARNDVVIAFTGVPDRQGQSNAVARLCPELAATAARLRSR